MDYKTYRRKDARAKYGKKKNFKKSILKLSISSLSLVFLLGTAKALKSHIERSTIMEEIAQFPMHEEQQEFENNYVEQISSKEQDETEWNLILVNGKNPVPAEYMFELTTLSNGQAVDSRMYPYLQAMFDAARADDVFPVVASGHRTSELQQQIFDAEINKYIEQGYSTDESTALALARVARPGTSEHELGLAVDINGDKNNSTNEDVYQWLQSNSYKYGFILRYPAGKTAITGVGYEPWHFRYVGVQAASDMYFKGLCFEEYSNR